LGRKKVGFIEDVSNLEGGSHSNVSNITFQVFGEVGEHSYGNQSRGHMQKSAFQELESGSLVFDTNQR
jgi:hypothetical protein